MSKTDYQKFGFSIALTIVLLFGVFFPWLFDKSTPSWPWVIAIAFTLFALISPMKLAVIHKPWMKFGYIVGIINTKIILSIVFFLMFTPMALLFKLLGKDPMKRKMTDKPLSSYWEESKKQTKEHMEKVY